MTDVAPLPSSITVGLRFKRGDAEKLRTIADRAMVQDLTANVQLYREAADAAERDDPFYVTAEDREDLHLLIAGLVFNGLDAPAIEAARIG